MKKKRYRNYTAKKYRLPKRILFFVICAIAIFIFALVLGHNLKAKMENADIDREPIETNNNAETAPPSGIEDGNAQHSEKYANIKAGHLDIIAAADTSEVRATVDKLKADGFNAISFVCISDGKLTYASKATSEYSRLPSSESIVTFENLTEAVSYAKSKGMQTSAFYLKGTEETLDYLICGELASIGFDEIILSGFENLLTENGGEITPCIEYLKKIRSGIGNCALSLSLKPAAYTHARNSYQIEKLFTYAEFMTVDMTELDADSAAELCSKISGSFSIYMLRPILMGEATDISAVLLEKDIVSVQYISNIPSPEPEDTTDTAGND